METDGNRWKPNSAKTHLGESRDDTTVRESGLVSHLITQHHAVHSANGNRIPRNSAKTHRCESCDYTTMRKCDFISHLTTQRHAVNSANGNHGNQIPRKTLNQTCMNCAKTFANRSGLWKHRQTCLPESPLNDLDKDALIMTLLKQNAELIKGQQDIILKLTENGVNHTTNNTVTNTHTNSHNKAFNLQFFLNETCKNAMNITDFVDSIKLQLSDLIEMGEVGYVDGLSKIIVKNLNQLDETERPIHCTDKKRDTMYVKDEGTWVKEDDKKTKMTKLVKNLADKNIRLLPQFREKYPDYGDSSSRTSDRYEKMVIEAMTCDDIKNDKIIKNISKAVTIKSVL